MGHSVHLQELQQIAGRYVDQYQLMTAGAPLAVAGTVRLFVGRSKIAGFAVRGGAMWFLVKELSGPLYGLFNEQFGYLQRIFGLYGF